MRRLDWRGTVAIIGAIAGLLGALSPVLSKVVDTWARLAEIEKRALYGNMDTNR